MRTRFTAFALLGALALLGSCDRGPDEFETEQNPDCSLPGEPEEDPALQAGAPALVIGEVDEDSGAFTAWRDGDEVAAQLGSQGALMFTPTLRLTGQGMRSERCLHVTFTVTGPETATIRNAFEFSEGDGDLVAGPVYVPLSGTSFDDDFDVRALVTGELYQSVAELRVHLVGEL